MSIKPEFSYIVLNNNGVVVTLYCNTIETSVVTEKFERNEFKRKVLVSAPETNGTIPIVGNNVFGVPYQLLSTSIGTTARDLRPDDQGGAALLIFQKQVIDRYTLVGEAGYNSDIQLAYSWAKAHRVFLDNFDAHQKWAAEGNMSIAELQTLQNETFAYLTSTTLSMTSNVTGTVSNLVIRDFSMDGDYDITNWDASTTELSTWKMTMDVISIQSDTPGTYF